LIVNPAFSVWLMTRLAGRLVWFPIITGQTTAGFGWPPAVVCHRRRQTRLSQTVTFRTRSIWVRPQAGGQGGYGLEFPGGEHRLLVLFAQGA
jgi:hypothetical protein